MQTLPTCRMTVTFPAFFYGTFEENFPVTHSPMHVSKSVRVSNSPTLCAPLDALPQPVAARC